MKTRIILLIAICIVANSVYSIAPDPTPWFTISRKGISEVYIIKYAGSRTGNVVVTVKDSKSNLIITRSVTAVRDFTLPLNFSSVPEGEYTIEINNGSETVTQTMNFKNESAPTYTHVTNLGDKHYLFAVSHAGLEKILIVISDGDGRIVFEENREINGDTAFLFDLSKVSGQPTFDITEDSGHSLMIPRTPLTIAIKK